MKYKYEGPVKRFDITVIPMYVAETLAVSEAKALANFAFRAKQKLGLLPTAKLSLDKKYLKSTPEPGEDVQLSFL